MKEAYTKIGVDMKKVHKLSDYVKSLKETSRAVTEDVRSNMQISLPPGIMKDVEDKVDFTKKSSDELIIEASNNKDLKTIGNLCNSLANKVVSQSKKGGYDPSKVGVGNLGGDAAASYNKKSKVTNIDSGQLLHQSLRNNPVERFLQHEKKHKEHEENAKVYGKQFVDPDHKIIEGLNSLVDEEENGNAPPEAYKPDVSDVRSIASKNGVSISNLVQLYKEGKVQEIAGQMDYETERRVA